MCKQFDLVLLLIFLLFSLPEETFPKNIAEADVKKCTAYIFYQVLHVWGLIFRPLIQLEFVFVCVSC